MVHGTWEERCSVSVRHLLTRELTGRQNRTSFLPASTAGPTNPKVIRLHTHTTDTIPLRNLLQSTSALHSLARCSGESFACLLFFRLLSVFRPLHRSFASPTLPNSEFFSAGFRSDGSGSTHSHKRTKIADSTQFFPFLCCFLLALFLPSRGNHFFLLLPRTPSSLPRWDHFTDSSTGTTFLHNPEHSPFEGTSKLLLLFFFFSPSVARGLLFFFFC